MKLLDRLDAMLKLPMKGKILTETGEALKKYRTLQGEIKSQIEVLNSKLKAHAMKQKGNFDDWSFPKDLDKTLEHLKNSTKSLM